MCYINEIKITFYFSDYVLDETKKKLNVNIFKKINKSFLSRIFTILRTVIVFKRLLFSQPKKLEKKISDIKIIKPCVFLSQKHNYNIFFFFENNIKINSNPCDVHRVGEFVTSVEILVGNFVFSRYIQ